MRNRFLILFLIPLALPAANAQDKARPNPYEERFQQLDSNRDGYVSLAEWPLERTKFDLVDRNDDGRLSRTELLTPNVVRDRDALRERLRQADTDRDGRLSQEERERGRLVNEARDPENAWSSRATLRDQRSFQNLDRDHDNRLSRRELRDTRFDRLDRNKDGVVSPREWPRP